ncbi:ATP-binding protein [Amycolatopsis acidicola]|uniref:ATP-binding protein n=1 Tax=Amycolatopsis acidicola TaxID=2596893 RepID=A0A5N0UT52_9PSEU|nr:ATP-binding protein [Amycolatopsis acidicola]KAA9152409.1 ATP-binding protein [Amycolatopsis acidicola]
MGHTGEAELDGDGARALAAGLGRLVRVAATVVEADSPANALVNRVTGHLGAELQDLVFVGQEFPPWEHVNVHRGVDRYLAERGGGHEWFGIAGVNRTNEELIGMLATARRHGTYELGAVDYRTEATGPETTEDVVQFGLVTTSAPGGTPVIIAQRGPIAQHGPSAVSRFEVISTDRDAAGAVRDQVERRMRENDVLRGQVLAFGSSEFRGNELLTFLPRPELTAAEVVLPDGVLPTIERHTVGIAGHAERLRAAGQHLKRGLLLHGPPGTGKTHTLRYLMGRLSGNTVIILTGGAMRFIGKAAELARRLQPSILVLEDVDLVAQDRSHAGTNPLLFTLLDAMDGIGADADVTFVLTTNRASELEQALADRPGRVDLAVEIPKPDAAGRRRLIELYGRNVDLRADLEPVVAQTDGVTASYLKELLRRAVLHQMHEGVTGDPVPVDDAALAEALREMNESHNSLTRSLLGSR